MADSTFVDELLSHTGWLQRLARGLVQDHNAADDLVQTSLSAALVKPPRTGGVGLRAWLRRVMVNRVRQDHRETKIRERLRGHVAISNEVPSTSTLVARTEIQGVLIQALLALDDPYRATILRRYYDNRSAAEIAREEAVPESTVRNRLRRGLGRLRESLHARYRDKDTEWLPAVAALALPSAKNPANWGLLFRLGKMPKLALTCVPILGLALLGAFLSPFGGSPVPPATSFTSVIDRDISPASSELDLANADPDEQSTLRRTELTAPQLELMELQVLSQDDVPVADAEVRFASSSRALEQNQARNGPDHPHSDIYRFAFLAEEYGERRTTNTDGIAWLPVSEDRLLVVARRESSFGTITVEGGRREPVKLRLAAEQILELRSVDQSGQPVGNLPMRVAVRVPGKADNTLWIGTTDEKGYATVPHFQLLQPVEGASGQAQYGVCFDFPVQPHVTAEFFDPLPTMPIVLAAPTHGYLELSFTDRLGTPLAVPVQFYRLQIEFPGESDATDAFPPGERRWVSGFRNVGEHETRLPIGLEAQIVTSGQFDPLGEIEEVGFLGPRTQGETVKHALRLKAGYRVIRGTLQREGSVATDEADIRAVLTRGIEQSSVHDPVMISEGNFELIVRSPATPWPTDIYLHLREPEGREFAADLPLPASEIVDLGLVELEPLKSPIEGMVVDDVGGAIAGAEIQGWRMDLAEWVRDQRFQTTTDNEGAFRFFSADTVVALALRPERRGYLAKEPVLLPHSEPLRMVRSAEISGTLVVPEWFDHSNMSVGATLLTEEDAEVPVEPELRGGLVSFRIRDLWPGRYRLQLKLDGEPEPFRDLGVFEVAPGEKSEEDRLRDIDLRNDLFRMQVAITDDLGSPLTLPGAGLDVYFPTIGGAVLKQVVRWRGAPAEIVTSHTDLTIEFVAPGYEPWHGTIRSGPNILQLHRQR